MIVISIGIDMQNQNLIFDTSKHTFDRMHAYKENHAGRITFFIIPG